MTITQKLHHVARILSTRIQGHTTATIAGAASNPLSLLITSTMRHAQQIQSKHQSIDVTSIDRIDQIHGRRGPVLIDHTAIAELAHEAATRIEAIQAETKRLEAELAAASRDQQTLLIAQQTINDLQVALAKHEQRITEATHALHRIGLNPQYYQTLEMAVMGATETVADLRQQLADPPADVQEAVLHKLGLVEGKCELKRANDGTISITSATDVFPCHKATIQKLLDVHNQAIALKAAKGRHNTQIAAERLFDLLP